MDGYKYNCYKLYDDDVVCYIFVRDTLLNVDNIKEYYLLDDDDDDIAYKHSIFNKDYDMCEDFYWSFEAMTRHCKFDYYYIMYKKIIPAVFTYADEFDMQPDVINWIQNNDDVRIVSLYALSIADGLIDNYRDFIKDVLLDTTAKKIAINKIKRNKIVNDGLLLNLSMRDCGMF